MSEAHSVGERGRGGGGGRKRQKKGQKRHAVVAATWAAAVCFTSLRTRSRRASSPSPQSPSLQREHSRRPLRRGYARAAQHRKVRRERRSGGGWKETTNATKKHARSLPLRRSLLSLSLSPPLLRRPHARYSTARARARGKGKDRERARRGGGGKGAREEQECKQKRHVAMENGAAHPQISIETVMAERRRRWVRGRRCRRCSRDLPREREEGRVSVCVGKGNCRLRKRSARQQENVFAAADALSACASPSLVTIGLRRVHQRAAKPPLSRTRQSKRPRGRRARWRGGIAQPAAIVDLAAVPR